MAQLLGTLIISAGMAAITVPMGVAFIYCSIQTSSEHLKKRALEDALLIIEFNHRLDSFTQGPYPLPLSDAAVMQQLQASVPHLTVTNFTGKVAVALESQAIVRGPNPKDPVAAGGDYGFDILVVEGEAGQLMMYGLWWNGTAGTEVQPVWDYGTLVFDGVVSACEHALSGRRGNMTLDDFVDSAGNVVEKVSSVGLFSLYPSLLHPSTSVSALRGFHENPRFPLSVQFNGSEPLKDKALP